jgi:hypothetical protein
MDNLSIQESENKAKPLSRQEFKEVKNEINGAVQGTATETIYFHQHFSDHNKSKFPPSLVLVQDEKDGLLALVSENQNGEKPKLSFKKLDEAMSVDSGYNLELLTDKNILTAMIHNFKAGYNQTNLAFDKVYIALNRPIEKVREWVSVRKEVEIDRTKFSKNEVPYSALEKIGITRADISEKQLDKLLKGANTDLMEVSLKTKDIELKELPPYTIRLERIEDKVVARFTFRKDNLDIAKDKIGSKLTREEQTKILKDGEVQITDPSLTPMVKGSKMAVWNKITNVIEYKSTGASPAEIKEVAVTYDFKLDSQDIKFFSDGKRISKESALNPENGKREKAFIGFGKDNSLVPEFRPAKEITRHLDKELKER